MVSNSKILPLLQEISIQSCHPWYEEGSKQTSEFPCPIVTTAAMAPPHNASSTSSFVPRAASLAGEEVNRSRRDAGVAISFQTSAYSTSSENIEPASVSLPVPDEAEQAALSIQSGSEDISIHDNEEQEAFSGSDEDEYREVIEPASHNPPVLPTQPLTGPASTEGPLSSQSESISHAPSFSGASVASFPTESMQGLSGTLEAHMDRISPERSITNANTTSDNDAIEKGYNEVQTQADQSLQKSSQKEWRPLSLSFVFLLAFLLFQAAVLAAVEIIYHYSATNTGLATITDHDSASKTFAWEYLPIIIALLIAVAWVSISLETARIAPWRMLSGSEGANPDILFTRYLRDPFSTPFLSIRRLWKDRTNTSRLCSLTMFCSSLAHLLSFLVLPPLQASLMSVGDLVISQDAKYIQMPAFNSSNSINNEDRFGELYLKAYLAYQGLPIAQSAWISGAQGQQVAVLPIAPEDPSLQPATFQASTTAYSSTLNCTTLNATSIAYINSSKEQQLAQENSMPNKTRVDYSQLQYPISALFSGLGTHGGCQFTIEVPLGIGNDPSTADVDEWYYGGMDFLSASDTSPNSSIDTSCNQWFYLNVNYATLVYSPSSSSNFDFEATFGEEPTFNTVYCQAVYLEVPNLKVDFLSTTTSPSFTYDPETFETFSKSISPEAFNSTQFEELQFLDLESLKDNSTIPNTLPDGQPSTIQVNFQPYSFYFSTMVSPEINSFLDMNVTAGLPLWVGYYFQAAFTQRIDLSSSSWDSRPVNSFTLMASIPAERLVINVAYARSTEGTLALLMLLVLIIMYINSKSRTKLCANPNTIAEKCALICHSPLLLSCFDRKNSKSPGQCGLHSFGKGITRLEAGNVSSGVTESWKNNRK
jgi:hypothetical protein